MNDPDYGMPKATITVSANLLARITYDSLRALGMRDVSIERGLTADRFICKVTLVVDADDELGVFSALRAVVTGLGEHLQNKTRGATK